VLLTDKLIERARAHARGKRRAIGTHNFDTLVIPEKILHERNYGAPVIQAIVPAVPERQTGLSASHRIHSVTMLR
jgi:hypothetical protein